MEQAGLAAQELVMIGDTPYDVEAATRAGIPIIGFRSGGWTDADLAGAVEIYDGPEHLLANYSSSVLGRKGISRDSDGSPQARR